MKHLSIKLSIFIAVIFLAGCTYEEKEKPSNITEVEVKYYRVYPPGSDEDLDVFQLSRKHLDRFRTLMPDVPKPSEPAVGIGCEEPTGWFVVTYKDGKSAKFHFCTSKSKIHGGGSGLPFPVPLELYALFIRALEEHGYKDVTFGARVD
jgi:hypothetical protein